MKHATRLLVALLAAAAALHGCGDDGGRPAPRLILWAWERPEDLRFVPREVEIAVQTGFIDIAGDGFVARGRRFPFRTNRPPDIALVHVQIDDRHLPHWSPVLRRRVAAAVLHFARAIPNHRVQIDFEVRRSQRTMLTDLIADVRAGLPRDVALSMTALASWCQEDWLGRLPVDEVVPMLFRMGQGGPMVRARIARGGDWRDPACRRAFAISTDTPIAHAPTGRRIYAFAPRSWTRSDFDSIRRQVETW